MVVVGFYSKVIVLMLDLFLTVSYGFTIKTVKYEDESGRADNPRMQFKRNHGLQHTSVHHYARHGLCRTFKGKQYFYKGMKTKLCGVRLSFTAKFVMDLCRLRNSMLDKWVAEIFDINSDGYISHFEKTFYVEDD